MAENKHDVFAKELEKFLEKVVTEKESLLAISGTSSELVHITLIESGIRAFIHDKEIKK